MTETPRSPRHLREPTRAWWRQIVTDYVLEPHHLRLLTLAGEAYDRACEAREAVARDGAYFPVEGGAPRKHPAIGVERDAAVTFARLMRELDLDGAPQPDVRPPRIGSRT